MLYATDHLGGLDRWITGNYGEDQFDDYAICKNCALRNATDCPEPEESADDEHWCDSFEEEDYGW